MPGLPEELTTRRLRLRAWSGDFEAEMTAISLDPEVRHFVHRPGYEERLPEFSAGAARHWREHGYGLYEVLEGESFRGFAGTAHPTFVPELVERLELGWRLARDAWGRGLATEAALAVREAAFDRLAIDELISVIWVDNARSERVAEKLGMSVEGEVSIPGSDREIRVWSVDAPGP